LKRMKRENEDSVTVQRNANHAQCVEKKRQVRQQQRAAQERKAKEREQILAKIRHERQAKREEEVYETNVQLQKFATLAEEERRIIESLHSWRQEQQQAFSALETVLVKDPASPW